MGYGWSRGLRQVATAKLSTDGTNLQIDWNLLGTALIHLFLHFL